MTTELQLPPSHRSASVPAMHHQAAPPPPPRTTAKPPPSWRTIGLVGGGIAALVALIGIAAAVSPTDETTTTSAAPVQQALATTPTTTPPAAPTYKPFDQVEPATSLYFITLEATTLARTQGEERLYNLGLGVCRNLDGGNTIEQELAGLTTDARLTPGDAGALVGAAVTDMCPQHGPTVEQYLKEHG